uniref:Uncharacterized protein n=1 Tax=Moniliophthora roreri TaxID=221103 RepID=A0A0W0F5Y4_MONRR
MSHCICLHQ